MTDYMKEAKRLSRVLEHIAQTALRGVDNEQIRGHLMDAAALLAHIQCEAVPVHCTPLEHEGQIVYEHTSEPIPNADGFVLYAPVPDQFRNAAEMVAAQKPLPSDVAAILADNMHLMYENGAPAPAEVPMPEPVAYLYTLEYGETVAGRRLSEHQLNYPFGVCGSDYLAQTDDGVSYVRQIPLYTKDAEAAGYARGLKSRVPLDAINKMLADCMDVAVANGANSVSMPDHYVEVAAWTCGVKEDPPKQAPAREAAGYARGRKEAGRDAERYRWLRSRANADSAERLLAMSWESELDELIDAALRGEVKP